VAILTAVLLLVSLAALVFAVRSQRAASRSRRELGRLEHRDLLTGLPNRTVFEADLRDALAEAGRAGRPIGLLLFELDRYGAVNETYGHETGDTLMRSVIEQIQQSLLPEEQLYRYSGPQFGMIYPDVATSEALEAKVTALQAALDGPFKVERDSIRLSTSVGYTLTSNEPDRWTDALLDAVIALQEANDRGPGTTVRFEVPLRSKLNPATAERRLRDALEQGQFWLLYMPMVSVWDHRIVGTEALLRWADPDRGLISPGEFLKALDDTGLIVPVGAWVLREACRQTRDWHDRFPERDLTTTINVSTRQLGQSDFCDVLADAIATAGVDPEHLCIELTEIMSRRDVDTAYASMYHVKQLGVQLALDDFGTGYSTLAYMRQFQLDVLKIDATFVKGLGQHRGDEAIVQQMIGLAHNLGVTAVAEGVDTELQAETLKGLTCDLAQGYYYSMPQPVDVIDQLLARGKVVPGGDQRPTVDWTGGGVPVSPDVLST
jgi:diguanylate cyclase (GGDEF)-like protein